MVTANRCSSPWKIRKNVSEQLLENQYVGQEFLNQTALEVLVWNNQSQSELRDKDDVIVTSGACYTRKPLYDLIGKSRVNTVFNLADSCQLFLGASVSLKIIKSHLQWSARKQAFEFFFWRGETVVLPPRGGRRDAGTKYIKCQQGTTPGKHKNNRKEGIITSYVIYT